MILLNFIRLCLVIEPSTNSRKVNTYLLGKLNLRDPVFKTIDSKLFDYIHRKLLPGDDRLCRLCITCIVCIVLHKKKTNKYCLRYKKCV